MKDEFSHVSISLDAQLNHMYSFGRLHPYNPFWGGFNVTYSAPETVDGTIHVFYVGVNPLTQQPDSILMGSYPITQGGDTLNFVPQQDMDSFEVVVRTDDYDGHRVKLEVFSNIS